MGFDFSSDAACATALEEAIACGEPTTSDPVIFPGYTNSTAGLFAFQAVASETQTGIVAIAVGMETLVTLPAKKVPSPNIGLVTDLYLLQKDKKPQLLATSSEASSSGQAHWGAYNPNISQTITPIFFCNKTYAAVIRTSPIWLAANPLRECRHVLLSGLLLTFTLSAFVAFLCNRRFVLEQEVKSRTAEIQTAHDNIKSVLNAAPMAMLVVDERALRSRREQTCCAPFSFRHRRCSEQRLRCFIELCPQA